MVFPARIEEHPTIQLICVGPIVDIHGRFAATKLARLAEMYPGRICSIPEFTVIPKFLMSGADFALIPSRDEPFGLVAVEFGRQGALGVGSRLGGLGQMPGWVSGGLRNAMACICTDSGLPRKWYPVESDTTAHLLSQFTKTIKRALKSSQEERAILRARAAVQRFPVLVVREGREALRRRLHADNLHTTVATASR